MVKNKTKPKPRGRPQVSTLKRLTKSVTVKFSKPDYTRILVDKTYSHYVGSLFSTVVDN